MRILQITDTHLYASPQDELLGVNTRDSFNAVIEEISKKSLNFEAIILTGDLSHDASPESYQYLAKALQVFDKPIYWIAGNHDVFTIMQEVLATTNLVADKELHSENWGLLLLNSAEPGCVPGYLAEDELVKLQTFIEKNAEERNLMVMLHHQPIPVGSKWLDNVGLRNAKEFNAQIAKAKNCRAVVFGHVHQAFDQIHDGLRYIGTPSTSIQFLPNSVDFALDTLGVGYRYLELCADGAINTVVYRLTNFTTKVDYSSTGY